MAINLRLDTAETRALGVEIHVCEVQLLLVHMAAIKVSRENLKLHLVGRIMFIIPLAIFCCGYLESGNEFCTRRDPTQCGQLYCLSPQQKDSNWQNVCVYQLCLPTVCISELDGEFFIKEHNIPWLYPHLPAYQF